MGRRAEVEEIRVRPAWHLTFAMLAALAAGGTVLSAIAPPAGAVLLLITAAAMYGDLAAGFHSFRLFTPRRTTRNVTSAERHESPAARVILTAHHDTGRTGLLYAIPWPRLGRRRRRATLTSPLHFLFWTVMVALVAAIARAGGGGLGSARRDSSSRSRRSSSPTSCCCSTRPRPLPLRAPATTPRASRPCSRSAAAWRPTLCSWWRRRSSSAGAGDVGGLGMRAWLEEHGGSLRGVPTYFVNVKGVGNGRVCHVVGEGYATLVRNDERLARLCRARGLGAPRLAHRHRRVRGCVPGPCRDHAHVPERPRPYRALPPALRHPGERRSRGGRAGDRHRRAPGAADRRSRGRRATAARRRPVGLRRARRGCRRAPAGSRRSTCRRGRRRPRPRAPRAAGSWPSASSAAPATKTTREGLKGRPSSLATSSRSSSAVSSPAPSADHAEAPDRLALRLVGHAHDRRLRHRGVRHEHGLDLGRAEPLAGHVDRVVGASQQVPVAVVVDQRPVAVAPDVRVHRPVRLHVALGCRPRCRASSRATAACRPAPRPRRAPGSRPGRTRPRPCRARRRRASRP